MTNDTHVAPPARRWLALAVLLVAAAIDLVSTTVVTLALPAVQRDLHASTAALEWLVAGYSLVFALGLITGGRLGDVFGRRRVMSIGLGGFTLASALAGAAPTATILIAARVAQGVFAALMAPQVLSIISTTFTPAEQPKAYGMFGATAGLATVAGPLLGGMLIEIDPLALGWRAIFLINVPLGIITLVAARLLVPESREQNPAKLDLRGAGLMTVALLLLLLPLIEGRQLGWPTWTIVSMTASIPAFALFVVHQRHRERNAAAPLVPPALFRQRAFSGGMVATLSFFAGPPTLLFVTTLTLQGLGFSPLHTAVTFIPLSLASVPAAHASGALAARFGRRVPLFGSVLVALGTSGVLLAAEVAGPDIATWHLLPGLTIAGAGLGLAAPTLIGIVLSGVKARDAGAASGALNTVLQLGGAVGVALVGVVFFGALPSDAAATPERLSAGYADAMTASLWLAAGIAILSAASMLLLPSNGAQAAADPIDAPTADSRPQRSNERPHRGSGRQRHGATRTAEPRSSGTIGQAPTAERVR